MVLWLLLVFGLVADIAYGKRLISADLEKGVYARPLTLAWVKAHGQPCAYLAKGGDTDYARSETGESLAQADPRGYRYLTTHTVTVALVPGNLLQACEHTGPGRQSFSANPIGTSIVLLNRDLLQTDAAKAAGLSHELVHVRYGEKDEPRAHRSFLSQLWLSEEGEAHRRGLETAEALRVQGLPSRVREDWSYIYALQVDIILCAIIPACGVLLYVAWKRRNA